MGRSAGWTGLWLLSTLTAPSALLCSCGEAPSFSGEGDTGEQADRLALLGVRPVAGADLCAPARPGQARCHAKLAPDIPAAPGGPPPMGLGPAELREAYRLPPSGGSGRIVAVVDAFDAPFAERDLAVYRSQFGLPPCTSSDGCFTKVNQDGAPSPLPATDDAWAAEIALDLDMVSAACGDCRLLLVEARSSSLADLGAAVLAAHRLGAVAISNSYGVAEDAGTRASSAAWYHPPGALVTASTGDAGYGVSFPASSEFVLAVGGTTLVRSASARGWAEGAWSGTGSGCSAESPRPPFQVDGSCPRRAVADLSAVGDPATGVAVYAGGFRVMGGTSAGAPFVAGVFALLDLAWRGNGWAYAHPTAFFDVTAGANGACSDVYLCAAGVGYDGPTGLGTPDGSALALAASEPASAAGAQVETSPPASAQDGPEGGGCSVAASTRGAPGKRESARGSALGIGAGRAIAAVLGLALAVRRARRGERARGAGQGGSKSPRSRRASSS